MSRWWTEFVAEIGDAVGLGLAALLLLVTACLLAAGWYWYPGWLPRNWWPTAGGYPRRAMSPRRKHKTATAEPAPEPDSLAGDVSPELRVAEFLSLADRYAAQGRYAEAVRERLRAIVRELVDTGVVENRPGWTVTELARAAGAARPPVRPPLDAANLLFSDIWYGQRSAGSTQDARMRAHAAQVHAALRAAGVGSPATDPAGNLAGGPVGSPIETPLRIPR